MGAGQVESESECRNFPYVMHNRVVAHTMFLLCCVGMFNWVIASSEDKGELKIHAKLGLEVHQSRLSQRSHSPQALADRGEARLAVAPESAWGEVATRAAAVASDGRHLRRSALRR